MAILAGGVIKALSGDTAQKKDTDQSADTLQSAAPSFRHSGEGRNPESPTEDGGLANPSIPKPPAVQSDDVLAENQRMARALAKCKGIGDFDRFTTDAINTHGDKTIYEVRDPGSGPGQA